MSVGLYFRLDGLEPADAASGHAVNQLWDDDLTALAEHHTTPNGSHSYIVAHDRSVTWGVPGNPQLIAIKIARDPRLRTFTYESAYHATVAFAQNWLIERGCPTERIGLTHDDLMKPADDHTVQVEQQIRESRGRYSVIDTFTSDDDPCETWTLTHDSQARRLPIRAFLEELDVKSRTYTMREGAFADADDAQLWLDDHATPLPEPPERRRPTPLGNAADLRARSAVTRSIAPAPTAAASPARPAPASAAPNTTQVRSK